VVVGQWERARGDDHGGDADQADGGHALAYWSMNLLKDLASPITTPTECGSPTHPVYDYIVTPERGMVVTPPATSKLIDRLGQGAAYGCTDVVTAKSNRPRRNPQ
jgi:hypothetical protein